MKDEKMSDNQDFIMLKDVRCSFPHLWKRPIIKGDEGKFGAVFLLEKDRHARLIETIETKISDVLKERNKGKELKSEKICLRDGDDDGERPEYSGCMYLSSNCDTKPRVIGSKASELVTDPEDDKIFAGCYTNAKVQIWWQDNSYGKRVNSQLVAIQYARDGEALTGSYVSEEDAVSGFEDVENDDMFD